MSEKLTGSVGLIVDWIISMGWTGDLQAFAPTACFLYDTSGMLANWLHDLVKEQMLDNRGVPPLVVPAVMDMADDPKPFPQAVWVRPGILRHSSRR